MTEKVLLEFYVIQTEDGLKYKTRRGERTFILREPHELKKGKGKRAMPLMRSRHKAHQALETLENLYDELYPPG
jgi:hypothetical protein